MSQPVSGNNPQVRATGAIWGCAVGMLGICIPLTAITQSGALLPALVIFGAGGGTAAVWLAPDQRRREERQWEQTVKALEARVMNLETICTSLPDVSKPLSLPKTSDRA